MDIGRLPKDLKIGDKWFVDLDEHLDIAALDEIFPQLCEGIARSAPYEEPVVIGSKDALYDPTQVEVSMAIGDYQGDEFLSQLIRGDNPLAVLDGQNKRFAYEYTKYRYPTVSLGKKILLRTYSNYHSGFGLKHKAELNSDTPAYRNFDCLRKWIDASGAFKEIGRVIIFLTDRGGKAEIHCDYADGKSRKDQFIWLNPKRTKKFFVLDTEFNKQYLTGVSNTFDNAAWHGSDPVPHASFSIRVDGIFSDEFLQKTGLAAHYAKRGSLAGGQQSPSPQVAKQP